MQWIPRELRWTPEQRQVLRRAAQNKRAEIHQRYQTKVDFLTQIRNEVFPPVPPDPFPLNPACGMPYFVEYRMGTI